MSIHFENVIYFIQCFYPTHLYKHVIYQFCIEIYPYYNIYDLRPSVSQSVTQNDIGGTCILFHTCYEIIPEAIHAPLQASSCSYCGIFRFQHLISETEYTNIAEKIITNSIGAIPKCLYGISYPRSTIFFHGVVINQNTVTYYFGFVNEREIQNIKNYNCLKEFMKAIDQ